LTKLINIVNVGLLDTFEELKKERDYSSAEDKSKYRSAVKKVEEAKILLEESSNILNQMRNE
jgi:hypothetical protein